MKKVEIVIKDSRGNPVKFYQSIPTKKEIADMKREANWMVKMLEKMFDNAG